MSLVTTPFVVPDEKEQRFDDRYQSGEKEDGERLDADEEDVKEAAEQLKEKDSDESLLYEKDKKDENKKNKDKNGKQKKNKASIDPNKNRNLQIIAIVIFAVLGIYIAQKIR
jgi:hypothetical protein